MAPKKSSKKIKAYRKEVSKEAYIKKNISRELLAEWKAVVPKPVDPKKLHNFTFPSSLNWIGQRTYHIDPRSPAISPPPLPVAGRSPEISPPPPRSPEKNKEDRILSYCNGAVLKLGAISKSDVDLGDKKFGDFSIVLTAKEIEDDFLAMTGKKPLRRPKKRTKKIQELIDEVFPGSGLSTITLDRYKVDEQKF